MTFGQQQGRETLLLHVRVRGESAVSDGPGSVPIQAFRFF